MGHVADCRPEHVSAEASAYAGAMPGALGDQLMRRRGCGEVNQVVNIGVVTTAELCAVGLTSRAGTAGRCRMRSPHAR